MSDWYDLFTRSLDALTRGVVLTGDAETDYSLARKRVAIAHRQADLALRAVSDANTESREGESTLRDEIEMAVERVSHESNGAVPRAALRAAVLARITERLDAAIDYSAAHGGIAKAKGVDDAFEPDIPF